MLNAAACGLSVNTQEKAICGAWRGRCADRWSDCIKKDSEQYAEVEIDTTNTAEIGELSVVENSTTAIELLRQHFASPQNDHELYVRFFFFETA